MFIFLDDFTVRDWRALPEKEWQQLSRATVANKSLVKTLWLADSLLDMNPDIVCVNEVGGLESLHNFAKFFLGGKYEAHLIEGNSDRGIDIGYLVRKDFPLRAEIRTHKERPLGFLYPHELQTNLFQAAGVEAPHTSHRFSRDCAELRLYRPEDSAEGTVPAQGTASVQALARPVFVMLLVHLKSKLDPDRVDPFGRERRRAELNTLVEIYKEIRAEFTPPVPVMMAGDFNGCARRDQLNEEFQQLTTTDLETVVEIAGLNGEDAATQFQFNRGGKVTFLQIDFIFVSPELKAHLVREAVAVYRYKSELKIPLPLPKTLEQRTYMPSDHYPVVAVFHRFF